MAKKNKKLAVDKKEFLDAFLDSRLNGAITNDFLRIYMVLARKYSKMINFRHYTYLEDMIQNATYAFLKHWKSFTPENYPEPNAFAYYTRMVHNAFIQTINKENKQHKNVVSITAMLKDVEAFDIINFNPVPNDETTYQRELRYADLRSPVKITSFKECNLKADATFNKEGVEIIREDDD